MKKPTPIIEIYQGQSLAPPDRKGLTAGSGYWLKLDGIWFRIEYVKDGDLLRSDNIHNIFYVLRRILGLRKWPEGFE
jgi:hypothetical protein